MKMTGNTLLITGGGSGIGRGLAEAFHKLGNQVIIAGRRQNILDEVTKANTGMKSVTLDIDDAQNIKAFGEKMNRDFPKLNGVIHNAGIMRLEDIKSLNVGDAEAMITTNFFGPIRLTAALLPLPQKQPHATILTVTSGLAFVPLAPTPTYNATKAALHSYTMSLREQLKETNTKVIEIAPPYVQTELLGEQQATDERAMPLAEFIAEVMDILTQQPDAVEVIVERCKPLRFAERNGETDAMFAMLNSMF